MDPEVWGPHAWIFLHTITLTYPHNPTDQDKKNYKMFFYNLSNVLPCSHCSQNYKIHLKQLPIDPFLENKKLLVSWLIQIHNLTNNNLKKNINFDFNDFTSKYREIYNKTNGNNTEQSNNNYDFSKFIPIFLLSIPIILILLFIFQKSLKQNFYNTLNTIHNKPISI